MKLKSKEILECISSNDIGEFVKGVSAHGFDILIEPCKDPEWSKISPIDVFIRRCNSRSSWQRVEAGDYVLFSSEGFKILGEDELHKKYVSVDQST